MSLISEETRLANLKEQGPSILVNIKIANEELTEILSTISNKKDELYILDNEISIKTNTISDLDSRIFNKKIYLRKTKQEADTCTRLLSDKKNEIIKLENDHLDRMNLLTCELSKQQESIIENINKQNIVLGEITQKISSGLRNTQDYKNFIDESILLSSNKYSNLLLGIDVANNTLNDINVNIINSKNKLSEIEDMFRARESEYNKISEYLKIREKQLSIRERDLYVLMARFRKEFKKLHPDQSPLI